MIYLHKVLDPNFLVSNVSVPCSGLLSGQSNIEAGFDPGNFKPPCVHEVELHLGWKWILHCLVVEAAATLWTCWGKCLPVTVFSWKRMAPYTLVWDTAQNTLIFGESCTCFTISLGFSAHHIHMVCLLIFRQCGTSAYHHSSQFLLGFCSPCMNVVFVDFSPKIS